MESEKNFPIIALPRDMIVIVTGGNRGIGYQTAKWIAMMGATVVITSRSVNDGQAAAKSMNEEFQKEKQNGRTDLCSYETLSVDVMELDLSSLQSTQTFIDKVKANYRNIHVLVCNAGVAWHTPDKTEDGFEHHFQVNYLGHFLICAHLLPIMRLSGMDSRVVLVTSHTHADITKFDSTKMQGNDINNLQGRKYNYTLSKLYQVMQCYSMNRHLTDSGVTFCCANPGITETDIARSMQDLFLIRVIATLCRIPFVTRLIKYLTGSKTAFEGSKTVINCVVNPTIKESQAIYYDDCEPADTSPVARHREYQDFLLKYTTDQLKNFLPENFLSDVPEFPILET